VEHGKEIGPEMNCRLVRAKKTAASLLESGNRYLFSFLNSHPSLKRKLGVRKMFYKSVSDIADNKMPICRISFPLGTSNKRGNLTLRRK
jgi:hypothetical protein